MNKIFGLVGSLFSLILTIVVGGIVLMALIYGVDWFISGNNAANAGSTVHDTGMSLKDFVTSIFTG